MFSSFRLDLLLLLSNTLNLLLFANRFGLQRMTTDGMRDVSQRLKETQMRLDHSFPEVKEEGEYTAPETTGARRRSTVA